jgi:DNA-binding CsgD family transcriptional regulator/PAS domain-containing protein
MPATRPGQRLLELVYDAATESTLWRSVLTGIADLTGSQGGVLFGQSVEAATVYFDYNGRLSEEANRVYQERHMNNPWSIAMETQPVGHVVFSDDVVPLRSLQHTGFFDEVLASQDVAHNAMIALAAKNDFRVAFNICRSTRQGPFGPDERQVLAVLVPHLRRSIRLGFRIEGYRALQRAQYHVLDHLSAGVVLLDRRARIVYANPAATALGSPGGAFGLRRSGVTALSSAHARRLGALVHAALRGMPAATMSAPRADDGRLVTVLVSSVCGRDVGRFSDLGMPDAAVMLFFIDPANRLDVPLAWIMDAYGLTRAEARVAVAMSAGITALECANQLGLSLNTVKTHLRKVFAKTGTGRQVELACLVASIGLLSGGAGTSPAPGMNTGAPVPRHRTRRAHSSRAARASAPD